MSRNVKGSLFVDYVRMIRGKKTADWSAHLEAEDKPFLAQRIQPDEWYPMDTFERMGNAIFEVIAGGDVELVRIWGYAQVDAVLPLHDGLLAEDDPRESLMRFRVFRQSFFDFDALEFEMLHDDEAHLSIAYQMGNSAEKAAAYQTMGFFERLLELAGAKNISSAFVLKRWVGDDRTLLELRWSQS